MEKIEQDIKKAKARIREVREQQGQNKPAEPKRNIIEKKKEEISKEEEEPEIERNGEGGMQIEG